MGGFTPKPLRPKAPVAPQVVTPKPLAPSGPTTVEAVYDKSKRIQLKTLLGG